MDRLREKRAVTLLSWRWRLALVLGSIGVTLAMGLSVLEIVDRVRYADSRQRKSPALLQVIESTDPELVWEYRPNSRGALLRTNRYGFRERDMVDPAPAPNTYRIAFVGDSVTLAKDVPADQTFARRLEALVNAGKPSPRLETLNFGVSGYNALQVAALVRARVSAFRPNEVVYVMCLNDFDFGYDASGPLMAAFRPPRSFVLQRLARLRRLLGARDYHTYHYRENAPAVLEAVQAMAHRAAKLGAKFRVVIMPAFDSEFRRYPRTWMHAEIKQQLAARGVDVVDLLPAFRADGREVQALGRETWHLTQAGHELVAHALAAELDAYRARARFAGHPDCRALTPSQDLQPSVREWYAIEGPVSAVSCEDPPERNGIRRVDDATSLTIAESPRERVAAFWVGPTLDPCNELEVEVPPWVPRRYPTTVGGWVIARATPLPSNQVTTVTLAAVSAAHCPSHTATPIIVGPSAWIEVSIPSHLRLNVDSPRIELDGFWPIEKHPQGFAAWTRGRSTLRVDGLRPGRPVKLTLHFADTGHVTQLRLHTERGTFDVDLRPVKVSGNLVVEALTPGSDGRVALSLMSKTWRPADVYPAATDERELGVYLQTVEVDTAQSR